MGKTQTRQCGTIHRVPQRSDEWRLLRCGKVTASDLSAVLAVLRSGGEAAVRRDYRARLVAERLVGRPVEDQYQSDAMRRGVELEPVARGVYETRRGAWVDEVGFVEHPTIRWAGCSPDGFVGDEGLVEIKCPKTATHLGYLRAPSALVEEYRDQCQWQLACTGRLWVDLLSYDDRLPQPLDLVIVRVERDDRRIAYLEDAVRRFLDEVEAEVAELQARLIAATEDVREEVGDG